MFAESIRPWPCFVPSFGALPCLGSGLFVLTLLACGSTAATQPAAARSSASFRNPIVATGADPWVIFHEGFYYSCSILGDDGIQIAKAKNLHEIGRAAAVRVWQSPPGTDYASEVWAPELHLLDGRWYIYFTASRGDNASHRMFVLESAGLDPMGPYHYKARIAASTDRWAIDGTVLDGPDGQRYFVWSGWDADYNVQQNLYIAPMLNPWTLMRSEQPFVRIEAEDAETAHTSLRSSRWASAGQAVRLGDQPFGFVAFSLTVPTPGSYQLDLRFANGGSGPSSQQLTLNDEPPSLLRFPALGAENFQTLPQFVRLEAGVNRLRLSPIQGGLDLDRLELKPIGRDRVLLSMPEQDYERRGGPPYINEGPQVLQKNARLHIIYSGSGSWGDDYNLIQLSFQGGDILDSRNWVKSGPVFARTDDVVGPGHASFVKSPDQQEDWIVYHAAKYPGAGWNRSVRTQRFSWDATDAPVFGAPLPLKQDIPLPSGSH